MMRNTNNKGLDERQQELLNNSMAISGAVTYLYLIIIIIYKLITTNDIKNIYNEIGLISTMSIFMISFYIVTGEYDRSVEKGKSKIKFFNKLDERQEKRIFSSLGMSSFIAFFYSIFSIIFRFIKTKQMRSSYIEIGLLAIISIINVYYHIASKEYDTPTTFSGKSLPLGDCKKDKNSRLIHYIKDGIKLTLVFLIFDIMNPNRLIVSIPLVGLKSLSYILNSFIRFIIFFILNLLWGEYNVKKQNKFNESLENDDIE